MLNRARTEIFEGEDTLRKSVNKWFITLAAILIAAAVGCGAPELWHPGS